MRNALERRKEILDVMNVRRHDTVYNLAFEFEVSEKTIRRDVSLLSAKYPIYCLHGYPGGVHVEEGFFVGRKLMTDKQTELLEKLISDLSSEDAETIQSILKSFAVSKRKK